MQMVWKVLKSDFFLPPPSTPNRTPQRWPLLRRLCSFPKLFLNPGSHTSPWEGFFRTSNSVSSLMRAVICEDKAGMRGVPLHPELFPCCFPVGASSSPCGVLHARIVGFREPWEASGGGLCCWPYRGCSDCEICRTSAPGALYCLAGMLAFTGFLNLTSDLQAQVLIAMSGDFCLLLWENLPGFCLCKYQPPFASIA